MAIADDLIRLETQLSELITRYEQYFVGFEKREPLQLRTEVERLIRNCSAVPINNTMYKHRYTSLAARFSTYREHWNRILRLIDEGKYTRDRFISDLHRHRGGGGDAGDSASPASGGAGPEENDIERIFREYREARIACRLPVESVSRESLAATLDRQRPQLAAQLGTDNIAFRVVVEDGKPKIKAGKRS